MEKSRKGAHSAESRKRDRSQNVVRRRCGWSIRRRLDLTAQVWSSSASGLRRHATSAAERAGRADARRALTWAGCLRADRGRPANRAPALDRGPAPRT